MNWRQIKNLVMSYGLLGLKFFILFLSEAFPALYLLSFYFLIDIIYTFYNKFQEDLSRDLSNEKINTIVSISNQNKADFDALAKDQKEYFADRTEKQKALGLLNKLLTESEIREKDLLALATSSGYYILFVYSASLGRLIKSLAADNFTTQPNRIYPVFLEGLGFARLGKKSSCFLINKNNLKTEKLRDVKEFKKFLMYHFSKIRSEEWNEFLLRLETVDRVKYENLKDINYTEKGYLKINFLLTETNMNVTNIGFVDGDRLGLGEVMSNEDINRQIFSGTNIDEDINEKELKIRIKKIISKQDISLLLYGIPFAQRILISSEQDSIKENLHITTILGFANTNRADLQNELDKIGVSANESEAIAESIISKSNEYKTALINLQINLES